MKEELIGQLEQSAIDDLKAKYGQILFVKSEGHIAYFRKPTRPEISFAMTLQNDPLKMSENVIKTCLVGGSPVFKEDTEYMLGAMKVLEELIKVKAVEVGNC